MWLYVNILFCLPFECTIIYYHAKLSSFLSNKDNWSSPWDSGWLDPSLSQVFIYLSSYLCWLGCRHSMLAFVVRFSIGKDVRFWLSSCGFLLGCCFAFQAWSFAKAKSGAFTCKASEAEDFAEAKRSAKQSLCVLAHAPRIVDTWIYIYIYMCMCREVVCGRTGCVLMDWRNAEARMVFVMHK